jgi:hypothetical protein
VDPDSCNLKEGVENVMALENPWVTLTWVQPGQKTYYVVAVLSYIRGLKIKKLKIIGL